MWAASAATVVNLDPWGFLQNNTYYARNDVAPNANVTGNSSSWTCYLYSNMNGSNGVGTFREISTRTIANNTNFNFTTGTDNFNDLLDVTGTTYCWDVRCNSSNDGFGDWGGSNVAYGACNSSGGAHNFSVDTTRPAISEHYHQSLLQGVTTAEWVNNVWGNTSVTFNFSVNDSNPDICQFFLNWNKTANVSFNNVSWQNVSYANNTYFNITNVNGSHGFTDNSTGYAWHITCNDSANNSASTGGIFKVDLTLPTVFGWNSTRFRTNNRFLPISTINTTCTDYEPQIGWNFTTETNFQRYEIVASVNTHSNTTGRLWMNVTTQSIYQINFSRLLGDLKYAFNITVFDSAYNRREAIDLTYGYSTDSTNHELSAGWNIVGNPGNAFTLSEILNWTGASTASVWNSTHQFTSHVSGGSNYDISVKAGMPVLLYMAAAGNVSDLLWNTSSFSAAQTLAVNLTNQTESDWNLVCNRNYSDGDGVGIKFQWLDNLLNAGDVNPQNNSQSNVTFMSFYNNSASSGSKYKPFVANWSINNDTYMEFCECSWMFVGKTDNYNQTINWGTINRSIQCYDCH
jgi:hypothetical protein